MVEYSDVGSNSFTPFCDASRNIPSLDGAVDRGDFPGCVGGWGARYLTLLLCAGCRDGVGVAGWTPVGIGGAGDLKDLGFGEILGLGGSVDGDVGPREAEGRAAGGEPSV